MSGMEDILKALVDSRQTGSAAQSQGADPMSSIIGGLLGSVTQSQSAGQTGGSGLGSMMGLLENVMGSGGGAQSLMAGDPIMLLLQPYVGKLAAKANIPNDVAMVVVSFVVHKLLSHHPTSGRDSSSFNLDDMLQQLNSGKIDSSLLHNSGMVKEISAKTGLDETAASQALDAAFGLFGNYVQNAKTSPTSKPASSDAAAKPANASNSHSGKARNAK